MTKPTQEQIIQWAREADAYETVQPYDENEPIWIFDIEELQAAFALAYEAGRKDENEACAEMCEVKFDFCGDELLVAEAIRARREQ